MARDRTPSRPRFLLAAGLVLAVAVVALSLWLRPGGGGSVVLPGQQTYVEGVAGTWQRINPVYASMNDVDGDLSQLLFSGLTRLGPDGTVQPDLADLPDISADGRTYTFHLRKNARWHDGQPLTSRDVAFTVAAITSPDFKGAPALAEGWLGIEVETPDESTVVFRLKQPFAPFLARNATIGILPSHLLGSLNAANLFEAAFNALPVGSGPYRIASLDTREAVLVANEAYHRGQPSIATVRLRFYSDYPSAIRAMEGGEIQGLLVRDTLTEAQLAEVQKIKGVRIDQPARAAYLVMYLNNDVADLFQDEHVRRALSLAIDREAIVTRVFEGLAAASSSPVAPGTWAYADQYDVLKPDVETARKLLSGAGWKAHPTTGILIKEGQEFRFTIRTDNDPIRVAVANEVARQLQPLGIRATVASTTFSVLRRDFLQERKYEAAIAGWDQGPDPDLYAGWHSAQQGAAGLNIANFANQVADSLIEKGRTSHDIEVRKDQYRQLQEVWQDLAPSVVIAYPRYTYIHTTAISGPAMDILFAPSLRFSDIVKWKL